MKTFTWCETEYFCRAIQAAQKLIKTNPSKAILLVYWYERRKNSWQASYGKEFPWERIKPMAH